eukprot:TRINITY_DN5663_c0_g1_i5.p2 TRINITY_DN5663_c0_g1~~TRINITY_DN5663_c0_g1_i5.p2  ORF type:complete len:102 (-),score=13.02 TRINITY_DN5663_c0_g1_i5:77-382(-)
MQQSINQQLVSIPQTCIRQPTIQQFINQPQSNRILITQQAIPSNQTNLTIHPTHPSNNQPYSKHQHANHPTNSHLCYLSTMPTIATTISFHRFKFFYSHTR